MLFYKKTIKHMEIFVQVISSELTKESINWVLEAMGPIVREINLKK